MKSGYRNNYTTSKIYLNRINRYTRTVSVNRPVGRGRQQSSGGVGDVLGYFNDVARSYADAWNESAFNREIDRHMSELLPGDVRTVTIEFGGGEASTVSQVDGNFDTYSLPPNSYRRTRVLTGRTPRNMREFNDWIKASIDHSIKNKGYRLLPADATLDRDYRNSRDRAMDFQRDIIDRSPRVDYDAGRDRDTYWA